MKIQLIAIAVLALLLVACAPKTTTAPYTQVQSLGIQETDVTPLVSQKELDSTETQAFDSDLDAIDSAFK